MQEQRGMIIYCLLLFQFIIHLIVCADVSLFSSYQVGRTSSLLMGNGAHAAVHGVGMVDLKLTLEKDRAAKERASCPHNKEKFDQWFFTLS
jgi:hypothetical protein